MPPRFASVVFDCDSTLVAIEGIDELAGDRRPEVAALTAAAMRGEVALEAVYGRRLDLIRPGRAELERLEAAYIAALVPDACASVAALHAAGVAVYVVSGGLLPPVRAVGRALGIALDRIAAVDVRLGSAGEYAGYDTASPLARHDGKRAIIEAWRPPMPRPILLVGDGATDLAARPAVDAFAAYTAVAARAAVVTGADFVLSSPSLAAVAALVLDPPSTASDP